MTNIAQRAAVLRAAASLPPVNKQTQFLAETADVLEGLHYCYNSLFEAARLAVHQGNMTMLREIVKLVEDNDQKLKSSKAE